MSGPKVTTYRVSPRQQAMIRAQIRAEAERRAMEAARRQAEEEARRVERKLVAEYRGKLHEAATGIRGLRPIAESLGAPVNEILLHIPSSDLPERLQEILSAIDFAFDDIEGGAALGESGALRDTYEKAKLKTANIVAQYDDIRQEIAQYEEKLGEILSSKIDGLIQSTDEQEAHTMDDATRSALEELADLTGQRWVPQNLRNELSALQQRAEAMLPTAIRSFVELEVRPALKRCDQYKTLWEDCGKEYEELYSSYEALAALNGRSESIEMIPFSPEAVMELRKRVAVEEEYAQANAEKEYIASALDEVMEEMGYTVWGRRSVTKKSGKHFNKSLYQYKEGAAINVTSADDGQITMELGKMDTSDRLPSKGEAKELTYDMEMFCGDFSEIERRLADRGVDVGTRISLAPPVEAYAQIININDYEQIQEAPAVGAEERRTVTQKSKARAEDLH